MPGREEKPAMPRPGDTFDYYAALGLTPDCDAKTLDRRFRELAHRYHPDHGDADVDRLQKVIVAYRALREVHGRADGDATRASADPARGATQQEPLSDQPIPGAEDQPSPASDADAHERILQMLYHARRENSRDAGVVGWNLQQMLGCSDESLDFHLWYLKAKGFIEITDQGTVAITIGGVDAVIESSRGYRTVRLLTEREDREG